jgi:hypothetical protein
MIDLRFCGLQNIPSKRVMAKNISFQMSYGDFLFQTENPGVSQGLSVSFSVFSIAVGTELVGHLIRLD